MRFLVLLLVSFVACAPSSATPDDGGAGTDGGDGGAREGGYDFSSCPTDAGNSICPNWIGMWCRVNVIRDAFAGGCSNDADCVKATYQQNCLSYGVCEDKPSVRSSQEGSFWTAVNGELSGYCTATGCHLGGSCAAKSTRAACVDGVCQTVASDGGP